MAQLGIGKHTYRRRVGPPQRFDLAAIALGKRPVQKLRRLISALKRAL